MEPAESTMLPPDLPPSSFEDTFTLFGDITDICKVDFHYHLHPDNFRERAMDTWFPSLRWTLLRDRVLFGIFVDVVSEGLKPRCDIIVTFHGGGELSCDYDTMLNSLFGLMEAITLSGFENLVVKIVPGVRGGGTKCPLPSEISW